MKRDFHNRCVNKICFTAGNKINLMTNNPSKVEDLNEEGFDVTQTKHLPNPNEQNREYLKTKAKKMRHDISID